MLVLIDFARHLASDGMGRLSVVRAAGADAWARASRRVVNDVIVDRCCHGPQRASCLLGLACQERQADRVDHLRQGVLGDAAVEQQLVAHEDEGELQDPAR